MEKLERMREGSWLESTATVCVCYMPLLQSFSYVAFSIAFLTQVISLVWYNFSFFFNTLLDVYYGWERELDFCVET